MSDKSKEEDIFRNEETLLRRAWIESALRGVRASLACAADAPEFGERAGFDGSVAGETNAAVKSASAAAKRPALYVAWSAGGRRSGT